MNATAITNDAPFAVLILRDVIPVQGRVLWECVAKYTNAEAANAHASALNEHVATSDMIPYYAVRVVGPPSAAA